MDSFFEIIRQLRNTSYFKHQEKIFFKWTTFNIDFLGFNLYIELTDSLCYYTIT